MLLTEDLAVESEACPGNAGTSDILAEPIKSCWNKRLLRLWTGTYSRCGTDPACLKADMENICWRKEMRHS